MNLKSLDSYADGKILAGCIDHTGYVVINNPERHNAVSLAMYQAAAEIVESMAEDSGGPRGRSRSRQVQGVQDAQARSRRPVAQDSAVQLLRSGHQRRRIQAAGQPVLEQLEGLRQLDVAPP